MANYIPLPKSEIIKTYKELVELHKRCITTYLVQQGCKVTIRKKFFQLYDIYIDHTNIMEFFYTPIKYFVWGLVVGKLDLVQTYVFPKKDRRRRRKKLKP